MKAAQGPEANPSIDPLANERRAVAQAEVDFAATQSRASLSVAFVVAMLALLGSMSLYQLQALSADASEYEAALQETVLASREAISADESCARERDVNAVKTQTLLDALRGLATDFDRQRLLRVLTLDRFTVESQACDEFQASANRVDTLNTLKGDPPSTTLARNASIAFVVVMLLTFFSRIWHTRAITNAGTRLVETRSDLSDAEAKATQDAQAKAARAAQVEAQAAEPPQSNGLVAWVRRLLT